MELYFLSFLLPTKITNIIGNIYFSHSPNAKDKAIWRYNSNDMFSVKSAYKIIANHQHKPEKNLTFSWI